ncbi:MAG: response regulator [Magnetovibrionaceae bacterium]
MLKLLVADDHPLFRDALTSVIRGAWGEVSIQEVSNISDAEHAAKADPDLDLIMLDLNMPGSEGFSGLMQLRQAAPTIPVVMVSAEDDAEVIRRALTCGAAGFIPKSANKDTIEQAMRHVLDGQTYVPVEAEAALKKPPRGDVEMEDRLSLLTPAERGVLHLLTQGKPNKIIAYELDIKESTVKAHISAILRKLGVHSRTQAVLAARNQLET